MKKEANTRRGHIQTRSWDKEDGHKGLQDWNNRWEWLGLVLSHKEDKAIGEGIRAFWQKDEQSIDPKQEWCSELPFN
jgi:hypothetical protein